MLYAPLLSLRSVTCGKERFTTPYLIPGVWKHRKTWLRESARERERERGLGDKEEWMREKKERERVLEEECVFKREEIERESALGKDFEKKREKECVWERKSVCVRERERLRGWLIVSITKRGRDLSLEI